MFRYKGLGHKWLKKKRVSLVEKNVWITERFFDNHYRYPVYRPCIEQLERFLNMKKATSFERGFISAHPLFGNQSYWYINKYKSVEFYEAVIDSPETIRFPEDFRFDPGFPPARNRFHGPE